MAATSRTASVLVSAHDAGNPERPGAHRHLAVRVAVALFLVFATVAFADQKDDEEKLRAFRQLNPDNRTGVPEKRVEWHTGYVELHYFGMDWRIIYLPLLAPLPGARLEDGAKIPNPFELTGTPYASTMPPMFQNDRSRAVEKEYKRIQKLTASTSDGSQ